MPNELRVLVISFGAILFLIAMGVTFRLFGAEVSNKVNVPWRIASLISGVVLLGIGIANPFPVRAPVEPPGTTTTVPTGSPATVTRPLDTPQPTVLSERLESVNLPGGDFGFALAAEASECEKSCKANERCVAWTWVKQGAVPALARPGLAAFCALKSTQDLPHVSDPCCVSGLVTGRETPHQVAPPSEYLTDINLAGGDFQVAAAFQASECERACQANERCAAWTWVKQGALPAIPRPNLAPFCALKSRQDMPRVADKCCVSGVVAGRKDPGR